MTRLAMLTAAALAALLLAAAGAMAAYRFQTSWGAAGAGAGQFANASFIAAAPDGSVYVTDTGNNRVEKFAADGSFLLSFGSGGTGAGQFNQPTGIGVGPDGSSVYVADSGNHRVQQFDPGGGFVSEWGTPGPGSGQFAGGAGPSGIGVGADGSVYVGDPGNARVQRFFGDGTFIGAFGSGAGGFGGIQGVAAGPDGSVYVADDVNARIERFDATGGFQGTWGVRGGGDGQFLSPRGLAASPAGVYVADQSQNRVQKFTAAGAFVDSLDATGAGDPGFRASSLAISSSGFIYVLGGDRVARYGETGGANLPPPSTGGSANAEPVDGTVKVKAPGGKFVPLTAGQQIPIGSIIDATKGTVELTTTADATTTQSARFWAGVFKLTQTKSASPVTEVQLYGANFRRACATTSRRARAAARKPRRKVVRQLWGSGKGRFRTKGRYASGAIRGTQWLTQDRCDATVIRVTEGSVTVRDFVKQVSRVTRAGRSYTARQRRP